MAKRPAPRPQAQADDAASAQSAQPRTRRPRGVNAGGNPADAAVASTAATVDEVIAADAGPSEEEIRQRAYARYLERGGGHGMDFDDWLEAERELRRRDG